MGSQVVFILRSHESKRLLKTGLPEIRTKGKIREVYELKGGSSFDMTIDRKIQQQACFKNINIYFTWYKTDGVWTFCILTLIILIITSYSYNIHSSLLCVHKLCYLLISFFTVYTSRLNVCLSWSAKVLLIASYMCYSPILQMQSVYSASRPQPLHCISF